MRVLVALSAVVLLSACTGRSGPVAPRVAVAPPPAAAENYVWARNDGRRMADNPELLRQGQADQAACRASAGGGAALNMQAFVSCMEARGYSRRPV